MGSKSTVSLSLMELIELIIMLLVCVMHITLLERKVLGIVQRRSGPLWVGRLAVLQPISDGVKLFLKESIIPFNIHSIIYNRVALVYLIIGFSTALIIPWFLNTIVINSNLNIIFSLIIGSLSTYSVLFSSHGSSNSYAFLAAFRAVNQLISYEVYIGFIYIFIIKLFNLTNHLCIVFRQLEINLIFSFFLLYIIFLITIIAETNRSPFDISEGESELVAGWNVEFSSINFVAFMVGEYSIIIVLAWIYSCIFIPSSKSFVYFILLYSFLLARATLCRIRQDLLIQIGWKLILIIVLNLILLY